MNKIAIKNYFFEEGRGIRIVKLPDWLGWSSGKKDAEYRVALPMIQRGFVWKPNQIIELWDTLLRGMPIGSLMVSEVMGASVGLMDKTLQENSDGNCLGLIDGQQRTLATLVGWPLPEGTPYSHRLWVDFADEPAPGQLVRLRVTTLNQPFGFQRNNPNTKLSLDDKRRAKEMFYGEAIEGNKHSKQKLSPEVLEQRQEACFSNGRPFVSASHPCFAIDMRALVKCWLDAKGQKSDWQQKVMAKIRETAQFMRIEDGESEVALKAIANRIEILGKGFDQLFAAEIPLLRVQNSLFESGNKENDDEPPLAVLFKRIGSNATPLSNSDYIYSILKHLMPTLHEMVNKLHLQHDAASLLTATDLVMSAFRLAAATTDGVTDNENPDKNAFHRLLPKVKSQLLNDEKSQGVLKEIGSYFGIVHAALLYDPTSNPNGLPVHAFPHLGRPLVQVLLRLAQVGYLTQNLPVKRRDDVLRLVLYWMQWVTDAPKASLIGFAEIKQWNPAVSGDELGKQIYREISRANRGKELFSPAKIKEALNLSNGKLSDPDRVLRGEARFQVDDDVEGVDKIRAALATYRHWWHPWNYRHQILLWLQREYVYTQAWPSPMAGNEEDTPYDYDHILPKSHWSGWTGMKEGARILEFCAKGEGDPHEQVGNAIGNVRVWGSSENRSDGADSPKIKSSDNSEKWLELSLIDGTEKDVKYWFGSPLDEKERGIWNVNRTSAFQKAVEQRTFNLFGKLFEDANFASWIIESGE